jgi:hypothetical protein
VFLGEWEFPPNVTVLARVPQIEFAATPSARTNAASRSDGALRKRRLAGVSAALLSLMGVIAAGLYFLLQGP